MQDIFKENQDRIRKNLELTYGSTNINDLEKGGKRAAIGEVRNYGGKNWVKHSDGWVLVDYESGNHIIEKDGKRRSATEDHAFFAKQHIQKHRDANKLGDGKTPEQIAKEEHGLSTKKEKPTDYKTEIVSRYGGTDEESKNKRAMESTKRVAKELLEKNYSIEGDVNITNRHGFRYNNSYSISFKDAKTKDTISIEVNLGTTISNTSTYTTVESTLKRGNTVHKYDLNHLYHDKNGYSAQDLLNRNKTDDIIDYRGLQEEARKNNWNPEAVPGVGHSTHYEPILKHLLQQVIEKDIQTTSETKKEKFPNIKDEDLVKVEKERTSRKTFSDVEENIINDIVERYSHRGSHVENIVRDQAKNIVKNYRKDDKIWNLKSFKEDLSQWASNKRNVEDTNE